MKDIEFNLESKDEGHDFSRGLGLSARERELTFSAVLLDCLRKTTRSVSDKATTDKEVKSAAALPEYFKYTLILSRGI